MNINNQETKKIIEESLYKFRFPGLRQFIIKTIKNNPLVDENKINQFFQEVKSALFGCISELEYDGIAINVDEINQYNSGIDFFSVFGGHTIYQMMIFINDDFFDYESLENLKIDHVKVINCYEAALNSTLIPYKNSLPYYFDFNYKSNYEGSGVSFCVDQNDLFSLKCVEKFIQQPINKIF